MNTTTRRTPDIDAERITALASEVLDWRFKAVPAHAWGSTAFDKWNLIPVIDDADAEQPRIVDMVRTFF